MSKISNKSIKQLAQSCAESGKIDTKTVKFISEHLTVSELRYFLKVLKNEMRKRSVDIISASEVTLEDKKTLEKKYSGKKVIFSNDADLGGGMVIRDGDDVIDLSMKGAIIHSVNSLKEAI